MASSTEFRDRMLGLLLPFGPVRARAMFGGYGLFLDEVMFGLIAGDTLYFKVDDENRPAYVAAAAHPFTYRRRTRTIEMSYYHVPQPVMADPVEMADWAGNAHAAARRGRAAKRWRR
jgi:DNA transformation protein